MIKGELPSEGSPPPRHSARPPSMTMDPASKAIIGLLQRDARRPYAEIAAEVGLDEDEVVERVRRLVDAGVMQLTAVTDPLQLGFARQAMLGVSVDAESVRAVAQAVSEVPEVCYVVITSGSFELLVEVVGDSDAHLLEIVTTRVKPLPGVTAIHTFLYLELQKQSYTWGVR
ncbi:Lrp/AsnC family transcriptional regulator [Nocardioides marmoraquaticus]